MANVNLVQLARSIAFAAETIADAMERRTAPDLAARARSIALEARRLAAELRATREPQPIREVLADVMQDIPTE